MFKLQLLSKSISTLKKYWKEIIGIVGGIILFPFLLIILFTAVNSIPLIDDKTLELYEEVAEDVGRDKTFIDYRELIGIDAVRYNQDFSKANRNNITKLANMFLKQEKETITKDLTNYKTISNQVHKDIDYRDVIILDSVLYGEELNVDNKKHIKKLAKKFEKKDIKYIEKDGKIEKVEVITIRSLNTVLKLEGKSINNIPAKFKDKSKISTKMKETVILYEKKSIEEVCKELGFTNEETERAKFYSNEGLSMLVGDGVIQEFTGSQSEFINEILPGALENYKKYKVYPSVAIAQAILESGWGKSGLAKKANNLFGIKAYNWNGAYVEMITTEYKLGIPYKTTAKFRKYSSFSESVIDHGKFLSENSRYSKHGVFTAKNYSEQARAIKKAGYATDPNYPNMLINIIKSYDLAQYDNPTFSLDNPLNGVQYLDGGAKLPYYMQTDKKWSNRPYGSSTIGVAGCGPTSLAMVVSGLTNKNVTPVDVANWSYRNGFFINGVGSSWSLMTEGAKHYGLKVEQLSKNNPSRIVSELSKGNPIIVSMGRGNFTRSGHIMVLRGIKNGKVLVSDPASKTRSDKLWDLSLIISQSSKKSNSPFWVYKK